MAQSVNAPFLDAILAIVCQIFVHISAARACGCVCMCVCVCVCLCLCVCVCVCVCVCGVCVWGAWDSWQISDINL